MLILNIFQLSGFLRLGRTGRMFALLANQQKYQIYELHSHHNFLLHTVCVDFNCFTCTF